MHLCTVQGSQESASDKSIGEGVGTRVESVGGGQVEAENDQVSHCTRKVDSRVRNHSAHHVYENERELPNLILSHHITD